MMRVSFISRIAVGAIWAMVLSGCERASDRDPENSGIGKPAASDAGGGKADPVDREAMKRSPFDLLAALETVRQSGSTSKDISLLSRNLGELRASDLVTIIGDLSPFDTLEHRTLADLALRELSVKDPGLTLDLIKSLPETVRMHRICYTLMARRHPGIVFDWLAENTKSDSLHILNTWSGTISPLIEADAERTVSLIAGMAPKVREIYLPIVMGAIAEDCHEKAADLARRLLDGENLDRAFVSILTSLSKDYPDLALAMLDDVPSSARARAVGSMLGNLLDSRPGEAASLLASFPGPEIARVFSEAWMVERLAASKPEKTVALADSIPFTEHTKEMHSRLAVALAGNRPDLAIDFLSSLPVGPASGEIAAKVFQKLGETDSRDALSKAASLPPDYQAFANRGIARAMAVENLDGALHFAGSTAPAIRQDIYREVARTTTYRNPAEAVRLLEDPKYEDILGSGFRSEMLDHTVRGWANRDLDAARSWVERLPTADRPMGVQGLMHPWMRSDPVAASEWLSKQPPGPARDAGARVIIEQVKNTDPEMAQKWQKSLAPKANGAK